MAKKLSIIKKIQNQNFVNISPKELVDLNKIGFRVERGTNHYKVFHPDLVNSGGKYDSGTIVIGTHQKDKDRLDFNGAQDLKHVFKLLGHM